MSRPNSSSATAWQQVPLVAHVRVERRRRDLETGADTPERDGVEAVLDDEERVAPTMASRDSGSAMVLSIRVAGGVDR
ncbi:MAG: hypothetical protein U5R31_11830 [Acidimicrobiia bacterium]|nr:hypothetical protein [Acidimicrobiia bacterium]